MEIFKKVDEKKAELEKLKPLPPEAQKKLEKKIRLEWNFHSNHIEGNTLTYGETQMLLFFGKATGDHEKREFDEMEAHDVAIKMLEEWAKDKTRNVTESDIRQLNQIILVKPFWKEAITPDGQSTRKLINPGQYKSSPNSVRLKNGEIHEYASPDETPILMEGLFHEYNNKKSHPLFQAAWTHHQFTAIHPFDDGNGRVARLWLNYILLKADFPPLVIRSQNKEQYLTALQQADTGDLKPFIGFLIDEMIWSLELSIKAAKGESLDELGDLDKKLALLKKQLTSQEDFIKQIRDQGYAAEFHEKFMHPFYMQLVAYLRKFDDLFYSCKYSLVANNEKQRLREIFDISNEQKIQHSFAEVSKSVEMRLIVLTKTWSSFRKGDNQFSLSVSVYFDVDKTLFSITSAIRVTDDTKPLEKNDLVNSRSARIIELLPRLYYGRLPEQLNINEVIETLGNAIFEEIFMLMSNKVDHG